MKRIHKWLLAILIAVVIVVILFVGLIYFRITHAGFGPTNCVDEQIAGGNTTEECWSICNEWADSISCPTGPETRFIGNSPGLSGDCGCRCCRGDAK